MATRPAYPKIDLAVTYDPDPTWPQKPAGYEWNSMVGLAVDRADHVWTFNRGDMPVQVYTSDGELVRAWGADVFETPHALRLDADGNVWLSDVGLHVVQKFTAEGELLLTIGVPGEPGCDEAHLDQPTDMAVTSAGDIFVSDGYGNNRIVHFDANGRFVKAWGTMGVARGELSLPHAIAVDSAGRLYVAERNNVRVQVFDQAGRSLEEWRNLFVPWGIWIDEDDHVFVCGSSPMRWGAETELGIDPADQLVAKLTPDGRMLELWVAPIAAEGDDRPGRLNLVHGIAVDSSGDLYLGDIVGRRAQKFLRRD